MNFKLNGNSLPKYQKKMSFIGHACRNNKCNLVTTCTLGIMPGKRRKGRPGMQYVDNINTWTWASTEESGVHTLGDTSAFVNPAGQLLL